MIDATDKTITIDYLIKDSHALQSDDKKLINRLSKFDMCDILIERTSQLAYGAQPKIDVSKYDIKKDTLYYYRIAKIEFEKKKIPFNIIRKVSKNNYEIDNIKNLY